MELLANVTDPRIPLSVLLLQLGWHRATLERSQRIAAAGTATLPIAGDAREAYEEPERWDGLS